MKGDFIIIPIKFRILLLLALFLSALFAVPVLAQQGLLLLEKGSAKVIGPERTRLLRKPGANRKSLNFHPVPFSEWERSPGKPVVSPC